MAKDLRTSFLTLILTCIVVVHGLTQPGRIVKLQMESPSLKSSLLSQKTTQAVYVYVPEGYEQNKSVNYPVVYLLHGYTSNNETWFNFGGDSLVQVSHLNKLIAGHVIKPFILVMPDGSNVLGGAFTPIPLLREIGKII